MDKFPKDSSNDRKETDIKETDINVRNDGGFIINQRLCIEDYQSSTIIKITKCQ
jgi:hypothetical protein